MDLASIAALCALNLQSPTAYPIPSGQTCSPPVVAGSPDDVALIVRTKDAKDAISRVAYAEAANQGDSGLAGVVYTILNRLADGRWGRTVDGVLNAPHQFEPVSRAGGDWRALRPVSEAQRARIETILNLALDGRLPDLTGGALFFQNPRIVQRRAAARTVAPNFVNFGGAATTAVIGDHSFYAETSSGHQSAAAGSVATTGRAPIGRLARLAGGGIIIPASATARPGANDDRPTPSTERAAANFGLVAGGGILVPADRLLIQP